MLLPTRSKQRETPQVLRAVSPSVTYGDSSLVRGSRGAGCLMGVGRYDGAA